MYLEKDKARRLLNEHLRSLVGELEAHSEFMLSLINKPDWTLVIQCHTLIESVITELLVSRMAQQELKEFLYRLPLSDDSFGKLRLVKDYNLLTKEQRTCIRKTSELRNLLVHRVENIEFSFIDFFEQLNNNNNKKKSWVNAFCWDGDSKLRELFDTKPRYAFWLSLFSLISTIQIEISHANGKNSIEGLSIEYMNEIFGRAL